MCKLHATRFRRHGDSRVVIAQADRDLARGERNTNWTGDQATYWAVHQRLKYRRGSAKKYQCVDCQERARQWSYDHADPNGRVGEDGLPYSTSLDHYQPRCVPCHKAFDLARIAALRASALAAGEAPGPTDSPLLPACLQPKGDGGRCGICRVDLALQAADPRYGSPSDLDHP